MSTKETIVERGRAGGVAILALSHAPVNAISASVRAALRQHLDALLPDPTIKAIVLTGAGEHFSAGADIREFAAPAALGVPRLNELIEDVEQADKPIVAALHGTVAGGAFEMALACHHRVAADTAQMSLPEVTLGFVPGAGGTQRLPRLCGLEVALDILLSGRRVGAAEAGEIGLVDAVVPAAELVERAVALAAEVAGRPPRRTSDRPAPEPVPGLFARHEATLAREARGRRAPQAALGLVMTTLGMTFEEGLRLERALFLELVRSPESAALRHVFFAEREARKVAGVEGHGHARPLTRAAVVGFGTMGSGIAMAFANAGIPVTVLDATREALERGRAIVEKAYAAAAAKGRLSEHERAERLARIECVLEDARLADADLVVEAVFEEMDAKRAVFRRLDAVCRADAVLATNTSSLDVGQIAAATTRPGRVVGLHFFSPAHVMRLVEVVRPPSVDAPTLAAALQAVKRIGKLGVVVGVCDGFAGNRMLFAYRRQADFLLEEGALPEQVDRAMRAFGMAMGPFETSDLAGLDVSWRIRKRQAATRPRGLRYSPIADRLCERGRFGQKTGAGWYRYEPGSRTPVPDPEVEELVHGVSTELGRTRRPVTDGEIVERCLAAMVNEGALILEEGVAARASDLDVIWIHGYGFPRHRGGPMFWAETAGLERLARRVEALHAEQGELVRPSALMRAAAGGPR